MKLEITKELRFIPEFNGNKDLTDTDRVTVSLRNPTIQIKNRCRSNPETVAKADPSGKVQDINITIKSDDNAVLNEMNLTLCVKRLLTNVTAFWTIPRSAKKTENRLPRLEVWNLQDKNPLRTR